MNSYSEFQVNIFSKNRDIRLHLENSKSKKGHNFVKNWRITSPTGMGSPLIVNNYSGFQVNIFSYNRDIRKCESFFFSRRRRRRQGYDNTSTFSSKTAELKILLRNMSTFFFKFVACAIPADNSHGRQIASYLAKWLESLYPL